MEVLRSRRGQRARGVGRLHGRDAKVNRQWLPVVHGSF